MYTANSILNILDTSNPITWEEAKKVANEFFEKKKGGKVKHSSSIII